jgi:hypothetical protein
MRLLRRSGLNGWPGTHIHDAPDGVTALVFLLGKWAPDPDKLAMAKGLLEAGVDLHRADDQGYNILFNVQLRTLWLPFLLEAGLDITQPGGQGEGILRVILNNNALHVGCPGIPLDPKARVVMELLYFFEHDLVPTKDTVWGRDFLEALDAESGDWLSPVRQWLEDHRLRASLSGTLSPAKPALTAARL